MIEAGFRSETTTAGVTAVASADAAAPERGPCGGICALCPNRERHAGGRSALAIGGGEHLAAKH